MARVPPPRGREAAPLRALIFDSYYDRYRGAVAQHPRGGRHGPARDGDRLRLPPGGRVPGGGGRLPPAGAAARRAARGRRSRLPRGQPARRARTRGSATPSSTPRTGPPSSCRATAIVKSMVFAGVYPTDSDQYENLRDALEKLRLNDASLNYEPETSTALGFGFRCGFLGLLHLEIVQERLQREFNLDLITTVPTRGVPRAPHRRRDDGPVEPDQPARPGRPSPGSRSRT